MHLNALTTGNSSSICHKNSLITQVVVVVVIEEEP